MKFFKRWQHRLSNTVVLTDGHKALPYLLRWEILRILGCSLRFHVFMRSDDDCHHDHPWSFISFIIGGSYVEETLHEDGTVSSKTRRPLTFAYRKAEHKHKIILPSEKPCLTLVFTFRKKRDWGFWVNGKFVNWLQFVNQRKSFVCE